MLLSEEQAREMAHFIGIRAISVYVDAHADAYRLFLEQEQEKEHDTKEKSPALMSMAFRESFSVCA